MTHSHSSHPSTSLSESNWAAAPPPMTHSPTAPDRIPVADEETFSRTILTLAEADLTWVGNGLRGDELSTTATPMLTSVLGAIAPLLNMVTHLRSPAGDWPPDLPWTPANIYPYVADEAYEVCNAYQTAQTALGPVPPSPPAGASLSPPRYWTLQDLAPRLLWAIAHGGAALMSLLSGVTAVLQTPQGEWQGGLLRLVVVLTATPTMAEIDPWAVDLAVQRPPVSGIAPDRALQVHALLPAWEEGTAAQLLTQVHQLIEQDQPSLADWLRGISGDWLMPGSLWRSGTLTLHCDLEFIPLPTLVMAATKGNVALAAPSTHSPSGPESTPSTPTSTPPIAGISVPLSLFDSELEEEDTDGETTIFFLDDDDREAADWEAHDRAIAEPSAVSTDLEDRSIVATIAAMAANAASDLMPPFPMTPLTDTPNSADSLPLTASSLFDTEDTDAQATPQPLPSPEPPEPLPIPPSPDLGTLEGEVAPGLGEDLAADLREDLAADLADLVDESGEDTLLTATAIFPDLPTIGTAIAESGPIARVRWHPLLPPEHAPQWREAVLRHHLLAQFPTWQPLTRQAGEGAIDPDPLMLALIETACTLSVQLEQLERGLLPPVLAAFYTEAGCSLGEMLLGLFWSVTRSVYAIAQWVGGVYAQVLQPQQGWQTGTLRLMLMLTLTTDEQTWHWDLGTRQLLTTVPKPLDPQTVICLEHLSAYPTPLQVSALQEQIMAQLRANEPLLLAWEGGLPIAWQAPEATDWQTGQWHLAGNLEFVATN